MIKSKTIIGIAITLAGLMISDSFSVRAREVQRTDGYKRPVQLKLDGLIKSHLPNFYPNAKMHGSVFNDLLFTEEFYPIGWSGDGKFAYIVEPADEACGCYYANLVIKDLKTDTVLWNFDYVSTELTKKDNMPKSLAAFWWFNRGLFSKKLREYRIRQTTRFAFQSFPIIYLGDRLTATLSLERDRKRSQPELVSAIGLHMSSHRKGKKIVYENRDLTESEILDVKLLGYLKSSFQPRVALILIEVHRGYEGPPHVARVNLIGSDLVSDFK